MRRSLFLIVFLFVTSWAQAYAPITDDRRKELLTQFQYTPTVTVYKEARVGCGGQDFEYDTTYPQLQGAYRVRARVYIPNKEAVPLVFLLPPLYGANALDRAMASAFCQNDIAVIMPLNDFPNLNSETLMPVTDHDETMRRVVAALKGGVLAIAAATQVNTQKLGIFGASLGGILGSTAYGVMPEISAATFIVSGGDVAHTLAVSDQAPVIKIKRARMAAENLKNEAEYEHYLNQHMTLDPLHFTPLMPAGSVKLYISRNDRAVPTVNQLAFFRALGEPEGTLYYDTNHTMTMFGVLGVGDQKNAIARWFKQRFTLANPRL